MPRHRMYADLAQWWPLLSPVEDYEEEAASFLELFRKAGVAPGSSCLELGSGGGHNAAHMKAFFGPMTLTDLSPEMLQVSAALNPECEHIEGDMRTLRLDRTFEAVFVHDAIEYMTSVDDLRQAIATVWAHLGDGGIAVLAPDGMHDDFESNTEHGGIDDGERGMRYFEWTYDPDPADNMTATDYVFLVREPGQSAQVIHEQHINGSFLRAQWEALLREQGFEFEATVDAWERTLFTVRKPG